MLFSLNNIRTQIINTVPAVIFATVLASAPVTAFGQAAENLNLKSPMPAPYNCYGRLANGVPNAEKLGWKVGLQYYTLHKIPFFEAIDLAEALGLHYIEATIGAKLTKGGESMGPGMSAEAKAALKKKLQESGVKCESIYWWMNGSGDGFEDLVKWCKEMGLTIVTDPKRADKGGKPVKFYEDILNKYGVKMVFTNHPKGAAYWNPDFTVEDTEGYGPNIGASVDFGHYMRGGFDACDITKRYLGIDKMYHFHMRDVSEIGAHGLDVPCGTGAGRLPEVYRALADKNVKPLMMLEYEHDFSNPMPYLIESVNFINDECGKIIAERSEKARKGVPIKLNADKAVVSESMNIQGKGDNSSIHAWNDPKQKIVWNTTLPAGNYQVFIKYSQPYQGSAMTLDVDGQELAFLFPNTFTWHDFTTQEVGIVNVANGGDVAITLRGIQKGIKRNDKNQLKASEAFPDVCFIELVPTSLEATSQPVDILSRFKGKKIFNGKDFDGWEGNDGDNSMAHFRIDKKAIVGGSLKTPLDHNQFVRTKDRYGDFELRLKYKVVPTDDSYNGGIQFRSEPCRIPGKEYEMVGYQADIISWKKGALYDEQRRWDFLGVPLGEPTNYKPNDWNEYVVRCEGPRVRIWLNGVKTTDYIEPFAETPLEGIGIIPQDGHIALQIHEGNPSEVWYKDIEIQELK